jgi:hypothetical protein
MSIADNFGQESNAGFVRAYDPRATRRQFQVSMMLVFVLALAAFALGLLAQLDWPAARAVFDYSARQHACRGNFIGHPRLM